jgi:hypothetical protein
MPTPNPTDPNVNMLSPDGLANQLFDAAIQQYKTDPREAARRVIQFLTEALFYAVSSAKGDVVVFLTETIIYVVSSASPDEAARKEMLRSVGETIAGAPPGSGGAAVPGKAAATP